MNIKKLIALASITSTFFSPLSMASDSPLEGSWIRHCQIADATDSESHYDIIRLKFSGERFSSDIKNFTDSQCTKPFKYAPNPTASGKFSLGNSFDNTQNKTVTEIDTFITTYNGSPFDIKQFEVFIIQESMLYFSTDGSEDIQPSEQNRITEIDFSRKFSPL